MAAATTFVREPLLLLSLLPLPPLLLPLPPRLRLLLQQLLLLLLHLPLLPLPLLRLLLFRPSLLPLLPLLHRQGHIKFMVEFSFQGGILDTSNKRIKQINKRKYTLV